MTAFSVIRLKLAPYIEWRIFVIHSCIKGCTNKHIVDGIYPFMMSALLLTPLRLLLVIATV